MENIIFKLYCTVDKSKKLCTLLANDKDEPSLFL